MIAKLRTLKSKHLKLEKQLKEVSKRPSANDNEVKVIKKKKLLLKDAIVRLVRKKSVHRKKRYRLRAKRLSRFGAAA